MIFIPFADELEFRDLDAGTWKDFEEFFTKHNGVQGGCWCMFYHRTGGTPGKTPQEKAERNHRDIHELVFTGKNRSLLVYHKGKVVASAQYGLKDELPRPGNGRNYKALGLPEAQKNLWRITCFFVENSYRRKGIAKMALDEVLKKIASLGGGIVEAFPVKEFKGNSVWHGTASMYMERGFKTIGQLGSGSFLVRKEI